MYGVVQYAHVQKALQYHKCACANVVGIVGGAWVEFVFTPSTLPHSWYGSESTMSMIIANQKL